jgi:phage anti-repressor protein
MDDFNTFITNKFNEDEEQIFLKHFDYYVKNYNNESIRINLEDVFEYIGFSRKDAAKRLIVSHFTENVDYFITENPPHLSLENLINPGGRPSQSIELTSDTFKELCLLTKTQKGSQIRKYYIKLEKLYLEYLLIQNEKLKDQLIKKQNKRYELGDTIYIVEEHIGNIITYKVGASINMNSRAKSYGSHTKGGKFIYTKRCNDKKALEDCVHHILRHFRFNNKTDIFYKIDPEIIMTIIDNTQRYIDDNELLKSLIPQNVTYLQSLNTIDPEGPSTSTNQEPKFIESVPIASVNANLKNEKEEIPKETYEDLIPVFDKYIEECFILKVGNKTHWIDISSRYRLWRRSTDEVKPFLAKYLVSKGFKETYIYDEDTKINSTAYQGLEMLPLPAITLSPNPTIIEQFIYERCITNVTGRTTCKEFGEEFVEWKDDPDYTKISEKDKKELNNYCNKNFLASTVHDGTRIRFGFYGISIKGKENTGRKSKPNNRKKVEEVNFITQQVTREFDSITHASNELGVSISIVSTAISAKRIRNGFFYRIKEKSDD